MKETVQSPRPEGPAAEELAAMLSPEEASIVLEQECPLAFDVSLSEAVFIRRGSGVVREISRRICQAVLLVEGGGIDVAGDNWNDVLTEVRWQYEGPRRRSA